MEDAQKAYYLSTKGVSIRRAFAVTTLAPPIYEFKVYPQGVIRKYFNIDKIKDLVIIGWTITAMFYSIAFITLLKAPQLGALIGLFVTLSCLYRYEDFKRKKWYITKRNYGRTNTN